MLPLLRADYRDRDSRQDGNAGDIGRGGGRGAKAPEDDMSSSLLDMDTSKLYAQVCTCRALCVCVDILCIL